MPTARRAPAALLVRRGGDKLLIDCAEGTQRQLLRSSVGLVELEEIFLTHFHADHVLGLPGMMKTFALRGRDLPLTVYGPRGLGDLLNSLKRVVGKLTYDVRLVELTPGEERERAIETLHQTATQAAELARQAQVGLLALTHLSNRYFGSEIAREAREIFPDTVVPRDFDLIEVPFAERGTPQLVRGGAARPREREAVSSGAE